MTAKPNEYTIDETLCGAVISGNTELAKWLVDAGSDINRTCDRSPLRSYLHYAVEKRDYEMVSTLLKYKINCNRRDKRYKDTPLHIATRQHSIKIVRLLLEHQANVDIRNSNMITPLDIAYNDNLINVFCMILNAGPSIDLRKTNGFGVSVFFHAIHHRRNDYIELMLKKGVNLNVRTCYNMPPLFVAIDAKNDVALSLFLEYGANIEYENRLGNSPLQFALSKENEFEIVLLLKHGAKFNNMRGIDKSRLLHIAAKYGLQNIAIELLQSGVRGGVHTRNNMGFTPLHSAASSGRTNMFDLFLKFGADLYREDNSGHNILSTAVAYERAKDGEYLEEDSFLMKMLKRGVDVGKKSNRAESALFVALKRNKGERLPVLQSLLQYGASPNDKGPLFTALELAVQVRDERAIDCLLDYGADVSTLLGIADQERDNSLTDRAIKKYTTRLKLAGFEVPVDLTEDDNYKEECCRELEKMRKKKILGDVTFYQYLHMSRRSAIKLLRNSEFGFYPAVQKVFPIYANLIERKFNASVRVDAIFDEGMETLNMLCKNRLPLEGLDAIAEYLNWKDFFNMYIVNIKCRNNKIRR